MDKRISDAFVAGLLEWNETVNDRHMPWKGEKDPYKIWLSEIILQQTRVEQGWDYFLKFVQRYPTVQQLASAPEDEVYKLWEGLGYYSRCKNLIHTARYIAKERRGVFPETYEEILALKGVGPYTAAAIASFAYNAPHAVVDGNVYRVLSRIYAYEGPTDSTEGKKHFAALAQKMLPPKKASDYNQALMDFGATICAPYPHCSDCFFAAQCRAYQRGIQLLLPRKEKKLEVRERWFLYLLLFYKGEVAIRKRPLGDVWENLYEFWGTELAAPLKNESLHGVIEATAGLEPLSYQVTGPALSARQKLTHQLIHFSIFTLNVAVQPNLPGVVWVAINNLGQYPFPKTLAALVEKLIAKNV